MRAAPPTGRAIVPLRTRRPSAASPIVPDTRIASPGRAPDRSTISPFGSVPSAVIETVTPPDARMVSPPSSATP